MGSIEDFKTFSATEPSCKNTVVWKTECPAAPTGGCVIGTYDNKPKADGSGCDLEEVHTITFNNDYTVATAKDDQ